MFGIKSQRIINMFEEEKTSANRNNPSFSSSHEGFAVILEEIEEFKEDSERIENVFSALWQDIKQNEEPKYQQQKARELMANVKDAILELIQVGAMASKLIDYLEIQEAENV